jgi:hypothetical protein
MPPNRRQHRIVVAEPTLGAAARIVRALESAGYAASSTRSLEIAICLVRANAVDLVLVNLSEYPAHSLARLARAVHADGRIRLVATVASVVAAPLRSKRNVTACRPALAPINGYWAEASSCLRISSLEELGVRLSAASWN